jgi:hypothetical protein
MYVRLCRVASRVPCDPTPGAAALLVASSPRIPPLKRAHFIFIFGVLFSESSLSLHRQRQQHGILSLSFKSKMRVNFPSGISCIDACGESHPDSRLS